MLRRVSALMFGGASVLVLAFYASLASIDVCILCGGLVSVVLKILSAFDSDFSFELNRYCRSQGVFLCLGSVFRPLCVSLSFTLLAVACVFLAPFLDVCARNVSTGCLVRCVPLLFYLVRILGCVHAPSLGVVACTNRFGRARQTAITRATVGLVSSVILIRF